MNTGNRRLHGVERCKKRKEKTQRLSHGALKPHGEKVLWECEDANNIHKKIKHDLRKNVIQGV